MTELPRMAPSARDRYLGLSEGAPLALECGCRDTNECHSKRREGFLLDLSLQPPRHRRMTQEERERHVAAGKGLSAPTTREGFPVVCKPSDPCWSLAAANWPGLTAAEAFEIVSKTSTPKGDTA